MEVLSKTVLIAQRMIGAFLRGLKVTKHLLGFLVSIEKVS
jgi:hypothetical protein